MKKLNSDFSSFPVALILSICFILASTTANAKPDAKKASLGDLDCAIHQIAKWDGNAWVCAEDVDTTDTNWNNLSNVPADIDDGDHDSNAATLCGTGEVLLGEGVCQELATVDNDTVMELWDQFRPRVIFYTSEAFGGNLGGLAGADEKCTEAANDDGSIVPAGDYIAILSTSTVDAVSRPRATKGIVINARGEFVADNVGALFLPSPVYYVQWETTDGLREQKLTSNRLVNGIKYNETGNRTFPNSNIWTGSKVYGERASTTPVQLCSNWTTSSSDKEGRGATSTIESLTTSNWIGHDGVAEVVACNVESQIYCLSK